MRQKLVASEWKPQRRRWQLVESAWRPPWRRRGWSRMCREPRGGDDGWLRVRVETPWLQRRLVACVFKGPVAEMTADGECVETLIADDRWS